MINDFSTLDPVPPIANKNNRIFSIENGEFRITAAHPLFRGDLGELGF
jgi:hypothetical protein